MSWWSGQARSAGPRAPGQLQPPALHGSAFLMLRVHGAVPFVLRCLLAAQPCHPALAYHSSTLRWHGGEPTQVPPRHALRRRGLWYLTHALVYAIWWLRQLNAIKSRAYLGDMTENTVYGHDTCRSLPGWVACP